MMAGDNILKTEMKQKSVSIDGYEDYFTGLMEIVGASEPSEELGEEIKSYTKSYVRLNSLEEVADYDDELYRRNYIGRDVDSGWEAIIMSWQKGNQTKIHSHPQYAGYTFSDGEFLVEVYESLGNGSARKTGEMHIANGSIESYFALGETASFGNHIHRITCLSDTGHSLHVYSDDALKGYIYSEEG